MKRFVALALALAAVGVTVWLLRAASRNSEHSSPFLPKEAIFPGAVVRTADRPARGSAAGEKSPETAAEATANLQRGPAQREGEKSDIVQQNPAPEFDYAESRKQEFFAPFRTGQRVRLSDRDFEILKLRAIPAADYRAGMGPAVAEKLGYIIVAGGAEPFAVNNGFPVVVNANGMMAVVTGTVIATLKEASRAPTIAATHDLELKGTDVEIRTAFFGVPTARPLGDVVRDLRDDVDVESVTLEILQSRKRF